MSKAILEKIKGEFFGGKAFVSICDSKGRTALDYAVLFKRPQLAGFLAQHMVQCRFLLFGRWPDNHDTSKSYELDVKDLFSLSKNLSDHFVLDEQMRDAFHALMEVFLEIEKCECAEWFLFGEWQLAHRMNGKQFTHYFQLILSVCFRYPCMNMRGFSKDDVEEKFRPALRQEVNRLCEQWDGVQSLDKFLERNCDLYLGADPNKSSYIMKTEEMKAVLNNGHGRRLFGYLIRTYSMSPGSATRVSLFRRLVKALQQHDPDLLPSLHEIVKGRLWYMLSEYIKLCYVNLSAPLSSDSRLYAHAVSTTADSAAINALENLSICQYLCIVAVMEDCYYALGGLLGQLGFSNSPMFKGMNLVQLACSCGNLVVLKGLIQDDMFLDGSGGYSAADIVTETHCGVLLALSHGHIRLAGYVIAVADFLMRADHEDENGMTAVYYTLISEIKPLVEWARCQLVLLAMADARKLISEGMPTAVLLTLLPYVEFEHINCMEVVARTGVQNGRIGFCRALFDMYFEQICKPENSKLYLRLIQIFQRCLKDMPDLSNRDTLSCHLRIFLWKVKTATPAWAARLIQAQFRGRVVYRQYKHYLGGSEEWTAFRRIWSSAVKCVDEWTGLSLISWSEIHQRHKMIVCEDGLDMLLPDNGSSLMTENEI
eukprot:gene30105-37266_t